MNKISIFPINYNKLGGFLYENMSEAEILPLNYKGEEFISLWQKKPGIFEDSANLNKHIINKKKYTEDEIEKINNVKKMISAITNIPNILNNKYFIFVNNSNFVTYTSIKGFANKIKRCNNLLPKVLYYDENFIFKEENYVEDKYIYDKDFKFEDIVNLEQFQFIDMYEYINLKKINFFERLLQFIKGNKNDSLYKLYEILFSFDENPLGNDNRLQIRDTFNIVNKMIYIGKFRELIEICFYVENITKDEDILEKGSIFKNKKDVINSFNEKKDIIRYNINSHKYDTKIYFSDYVLVATEFSKIEINDKNISINLEKAKIIYLITKLNFISDNEYLLSYENNENDITSLNISFKDLNSQNNTILIICNDEISEDDIKVNSKFWITINGHTESKVINSTYNNEDINDKNVIIYRYYSYIDSYIEVKLDSNDDLFEDDIIEVEGLVKFCNHNSVIVPEHILNKYESFESIKAIKNIYKFFESEKEFILNANNILNIAKRTSSNNINSGIVNKINDQISRSKEESYWDFVIEIYELCKLCNDSKEIFNYNFSYYLLFYYFDTKINYTATKNLLINKNQQYRNLFGEHVFFSRINKIPFEKIYDEDEVEYSFRKLCKRTFENKISKKLPIINKVKELFTLYESDYTKFPYLEDETVEQIPFICYRDKLFCDQGFLSKEGDNLTLSHEKLNQITLNKEILEILRNRKKIKNIDNRNVSQFINIFNTDDIRLYPAFYNENSKEKGDTTVLLNLNIYIIEKEIYEKALEIFIKLNISDEVSEIRKKISKIEEIINLIYQYYKYDQDNNDYFINSSQMIYLKMKFHVDSRVDVDPIILVPERYFIHAGRQITNCGETVIINFINFLLWNYEINNIDINKLPSSAVMELKKFYKKFNSHKVMDNLESNNFWALKVIAYHETITYNEKDDLVELVPTVENSLNLIYLILGINFDTEINKPIFNNLSDLKENLEKKINLIINLDDKYDKFANNTNYLIESNYNPESIIITVTDSSGNLVTNNDNFLSEHFIDIKNIAKFKNKISDSNDIANKINILTNIFNIPINVKENLNITKTVSTDYVKDVIKFQTVTFNFTPFHGWVEVSGKNFLKQQIKRKYGSTFYHQLQNNKEVYRGPNNIINNFKTTILNKCIEKSDSENQDIKNIINEFDTITASYEINSDILYRSIFLSDDNYNNLFNASLINEHFVTYLYFLLKNNPEKFFNLIESNFITNRVINKIENFIDNRSIQGYDLETFFRKAEDIIESIFNYQHKNYITLSNFKYNEDEEDNKIKLKVSKKDKSKLSDLSKKDNARVKFLFDYTKKIYPIEVKLNKPPIKEVILKLKLKNEDNLINFSPKILYFNRFNSSTSQNISISINGFLNDNYTNQIIIEQIDLNDDFYFDQAKVETKIINIKVYEYNKKIKYEDLDITAVNLELRMLHDPNSVSTSGTSTSGTSTSGTSTSGTSTSGTSTSGTSTSGTSTSGTTDELNINIIINSKSLLRDTIFLYRESYIKSKFNLNDDIITLEGISIKPLFESKDDLIKKIVKEKNLNFINFINWNKITRTNLFEENINKITHEIIENKSSSSEVWSVNDVIKIGEIVTFKNKRNIEYGDLTIGFFENQLFNSNETNYFIENNFLAKSSYFKGQTIFEDKSDLYEKLILDKIDMKDIINITDSQLDAIGQIKDTWEKVNISKSGNILSFRNRNDIEWNPSIGMKYYVSDSWDGPLSENRSFKKISESNFEISEIEKSIEGEGLWITYSKDKIVNFKGDKVDENYWRNNSNIEIIGICEFINTPINFTSNKTIENLILSSVIKINNLDKKYQTNIDDMYKNLDNRYNSLQILFKTFDFICNNDEMDGINLIIENIDSIKRKINDTFSGDYLKADIFNYVKYIDNWIRLKKPDYISFN